MKFLNLLFLKIPLCKFPLCAFLVPDRLPRNAPACADMFLQLSRKMYHHQTTAASSSSAPPSSPAAPSPSAPPCSTQPCSAPALSSALVCVEPKLQKRMLRTWQRMRRHAQRKDISKRIKQALTEMKDKKELNADTVQSIRHKVAEAVGTSLERGSARVFFHRRLQLCLMRKPKRKRRQREAPSAPVLAWTSAHEHAAMRIEDYYGGLLRARGSLWRPAPRCEAIMNQ